MKRYIISIQIIVLCVSLAFLTSCVVEKDIQIDLVGKPLEDKGISTRLYYGHYNSATTSSISCLEVKSGEIVLKNEIVDSIGREMFIDNQSRTLWVPVANEIDRVTNKVSISNKVKVVSLEDGATTLFELGLTAVDVQFFKNEIAITCLGTGVSDLKTYIIDRCTHEISKVIELAGDTCESVALDQNLEKLYVLSRVSRDVDGEYCELNVVNTRNYTLESTIEFRNSYMYRVEASDNRIYLAGGKQLLILNADDYTTEEDVEFEKRVYELALNSKYCVVSHRYSEILGVEDRGVSFIRLEDFSIETIAFNTIIPSNILLLDHILYVTDYTSGKVHLFNLIDNKIVKTYQLGKSPTNFVLID